MPATQKGAGEVHAVALETERRQNECIIGRGGRRPVAGTLSLPQTSLYHSRQCVLWLWLWFHTAVSGGKFDRRVYLKA